MQEFTEIDSSTAHTCVTPHVERWHTFEPISGRWSWLTAFLCCGQVCADVVDEGALDRDEDTLAEIQQAA